MTPKLPAVAAAAYLLGRYRKPKLAFALVTWAMRHKMQLPASKFATEGIKQLVDAGRSAVDATVSRNADRLSGAIHERTAALGDVAHEAADKAGPAGGAASGMARSGKTRTVDKRKSAGKDTNNDNGSANATRSSSEKSTGRPGTRASTSDRKDKPANGSTRPTKAAGTRRRSPSAREVEGT